MHRLSNKEGETVSFDRVLLIDNDGQVTVGAPAIEGASVEATILEHMKGDKVTVFKKKRRKGYKVSRGHRQYLTSLQVSSILEKPARKTAAKKAKVAETEEEKVEKVSTKKPAEAKKTKAAPKKAKPAAAKAESTEKKVTAKKETKAKSAPKKAESKPETKAEKAKSDNETKE